MRHEPRIAFLGMLTLVLLFLVPSAMATVWTAYPAPDSTQHSFQDALDLALPGDIVELMPGRYDGFGVFEFTGGIRFWASLGFVRTADLTIRSATTELAVIGPTVVMDRVDGNFTTGLGIDAGATGLTIDSVMIENMTWGISGLESITVTNCEFGLTPSAGAAIVVSGGTSLNLSSSVFLPGSNLQIATSVPGGVITVDRCTFTGARIVSGAGSAATTLNITQSSFDVGDHLVLSGSVSATAIDCDFGYTDPFSLLLQGASLYLEGCTLRVGPASIAHVFGLGTFRANRCHFESSGVSEMFLINFSSLEITNSNILHGSNDYLVAGVPKSNGQPIRLTNNFWSEGTEAEIRQFIQDGETFGDSTLVTAEILPIRDQQVLPVQEESVGSLKGMYRSPK